MIIIAEAGLAWNDFNQAAELAEIAKEIGADIVKYQWVENMSLPQLGVGEWKALKGYCDKIGIEFLCTPSSKEILRRLKNMGVKKLKIGSDRTEDFELYGNEFDSFEDVLISNGYTENEYTNMYCVSLYPCEEKYIDFEVAQKYRGFSDHTKRNDVAWCEQIKSCNFEYYEKHITNGYNSVDSEVSLTADQFAELIENLK